MKYLRKYSGQQNFNIDVNAKKLPIGSVSFDGNKIVFRNKKVFKEEYFSIVTREDNATISFDMRNMTTTNIEYIAYSYDNQNWTRVDNIGESNDISMLVQVYVPTRNTVVYLKGNCLRTQPTDADIVAIYTNKFSVDKKFDIQGNIMSLLYQDNFLNVSFINYVTQREMFRGLFHDNDKLINSENLYIPKH